MSSKVMNDATRSISGSPARRRARGALIAAMLGAVAVLATACPSSDPAAPPVPVGTRSRITSYPGASATASISADGQWVAYVGDQTADDNGALYLWSRASLMVTEIIGNANGGLKLLGISTDGRYVTVATFQAIANDPPTGQSPYVYSYDRVDGVLRFVAEVNTPDATVVAGDGTITFHPGTANNSDLSKWDPATQVVSPVLTSAALTLPFAVSSNGAYLALFTNDTNLPGVTGPGLYRRDSAGVLDLVVTVTTPFGLTGDFLPNNLTVTDQGDVIYTVFSEGSGPLILGSGSTRVWSGTTHSTLTIEVPGRVIATAGVSPDGRYLMYLSEAAPLDTGPLDGALGVFPSDGRVEVLDRQTSITKLIGYGRVGVGELTNRGIAADGSSAVFASNDPAGDTNGNDLDVFFWEDTP